MAAASAAAAGVAALLHPPVGSDTAARAASVDGGLAEDGVGVEVAVEIGTDEEVAVGGSCVDSKVAGTAGAGGDAVAAMTPVEAAILRAEEEG